MLCYSTGSLPVLPFAAIVQILKSTIFKGVELVMLPEWLIQKEPFWKEVKEVFAKSDLTIQNIHLGFPLLLSSTPHYPGICEENSKQRQRKWDVVLQCLQIAEWLSSPRVTVTSGILDIKVRLHLQEKHCYNFFEWILKRYQGNVQLGLEQEPEHVIHSSEQFFDVCKAFEGKIGANFDVGHSHVLGENIAESIQNLAPYLYNIHLEDIQDRKHQHLLFGEGNIDFKSIKSQLSNINYRGDYTPDLYPFATKYKDAISCSERFFTYFLKENLLKI